MRRALSMLSARVSTPVQVEPTNLFWVYIATLVAAVWYNYGARSQLVMLRNGQHR